MYQIENCVAWLKVNIHKYLRLITCNKVAIGKHCITVDNNTDYSKTIGIVDYDIFTRLMWHSSKYEKPSFLKIITFYYDIENVY